MIHPVGNVLVGVSTFMMLMLVSLGLLSNARSSSADSSGDLVAQSPAASPNRSADEAQRITLDQPGSWSPKATLADIDRDVVLVITPVRLLSDYWLPMQPQTFVWSRWVGRVDQVLEGKANVGDEVIVAIQGGRVAADASLSVESGFLTGSHRPEPGEPTILIEYKNLPRLEIGRQELLFLKRNDTYAEAGPAHLLAAFEGRYLVQDGALQPYPRELVEDTPVARLVQSLTITELKARLAD